MSYRHENLPWLLPAPADFRERCEALLAATGDGGGAQARQLATHNLDFNKLTKLSAAIGQIRARDGAVKGLQPFRLGIFSAMPPCRSMSRHCLPLQLAMVSISP